MSEDMIFWFLVSQVVNLGLFALVVKHAIGPYDVDF